MNSGKERVIAYVLICAGLLAGVVCYAGFGATRGASPASPPSAPVRLFFSSTAGSVLFTHKAHATGADYGPAPCERCHHSADVNPAQAVRCADCHEKEAYAPEDFDHVAHAGGYNLSCSDCHQQTLPGKKVLACGYCHKSKEGRIARKRVDAFHGQCLGCHKQKARGPTDCSQCHVM